MAAIEIRQISKNYGKQTIIEDISFDIDNGEFMVLVGPSGCGKSTLLRMISGLEEISSGQMLIDGRVVNDVPARERDIAMVFQSYALYPHMTVEKNMGFSLRIDGRPKAEIAKKVVAAAEILDLTALLKRKPSQLSGGQRQRVAMGRAIVREPKVFLFDEPLSNLDAQLRVQMRSEINALQSRFKTTTVYVTHDQVEAMTMADRIVVLQAGKVEQVGAPLDLFDNPANMFVAQFIGSPKMNLIKGSLEQRNGPPCFVAGKFTVTLPTRFAAHAGAEVALGLRPNDIALAPISHPNARPARLGLVEATGTETMVSMIVQGQTMQGVFNERIGAKTTDEIYVRFDPASCHVFDLATQLRL